MILTELHPSDAEEMFPLLSPLELYQEMDDRPPVSVEALRRRYEFQSRQHSPDGKELWLNWIVRDGSNHKAMGFVQATIQKSTNAASIAYVIGPSFGRRGVATSAVTQMIDVLQSEYRVSALSATVNETNIPSVRLLQRFDFKEISRTRLEDGKIEILFAKSLSG